MTIVIVTCSDLKHFCFFPLLFACFVYECVYYQKNSNDENMVGMIQDNTFSNLKSEAMSFFFGSAGQAHAARLRLE